MSVKSGTIAVVGLGYVGLPLAVAFARHRSVIGFDHDASRIEALRRGNDWTGEVSDAVLAERTGLTLSNDTKRLSAAEIFIIAVPTPVDETKRPDLSLLVDAAHTVGGAMAANALVIVESTVYPGCTETVVAEALASASGLKPHEDFHLGYSPERANPGDPRHRLETIVKVTAGATDAAADAVDALYKLVVSAGSHRAPSIAVAEAAKVIENTQRDLNIALMNELAILFHKLELDTGEVLEAARTKWNFLPFTPGLVGGHCIGVDPYYLTHRAVEAGYHPEIILAGRRINDGMGAHVVDRVARLMMRRRLSVVDSRILVLGLAFKEDCPDMRNSQVVDIVAGFEDLNALVDVTDPCVDPADAETRHGLCLTAEPAAGSYDAVILAVPHRSFRDAGAAAIRAFTRGSGVFFDVKGAFAKEASDGRL
ncbi:MAG: nucleotide sugar dehydrogenase [Pseudomonadota bacterium]